MYRKPFGLFKFHAELGISVFEFEVSDRSVYEREGWPGMTNVGIPYERNIHISEDSFQLLQIIVI